MNFNDVLRKLRYALNLKDNISIEIFQKGGLTVTQPHLLDIMKKEEEPGFIECTDLEMDSFLNGLIIYKRGPRDDQKSGNSIPEKHLSNNTVLKKLRIALELKEENLIEIMGLSGFKASKAEINALFRKKGHPNYKACGDQLLRNFLKGLTLYKKPQK